MRSHRSHDPWPILVAAARALERDDEFIVAPFGFSARVVAIALGRQPRFLDLAAPYAGRALAVAWSLAACSILLSYDQIIECFV